MSTYLYLQCLSHDPPIRSYGDVGSNLSQLPEIQEDVKNRDKIVAETDYETIHDDGWTRAKTRALFFRDHPKCTLGIIDEYNKTHPITAEEPEQVSEEIRTTSSTGGEKGVKLERFDLIPTGPLLELARLYGNGALKYEDRNWERGYEWGKSYAALQRHATAFWSGEEYDAHNPDCSVDCTTHTGAHHMAAVAWHAFVLIEFTKTHPEFDDRAITKENHG